jgi:large subunit ribosomal protein L25
MEAILNAVKREAHGKNEVGRLRRSGMIPAVLYGASGDGGRPEAVSIAVSPKELQRILHSGQGANTLIGLDVEGETARVMIRDYQLDPVTHSLLHADFYRIALDRRVTVTVPIVLKGESRGVKQQGGLLDFVHRELEIECLPADIPEHVEVDVSDLLLNQSVRLRDIAENVKWTPTSDPEMMIVHVVAPRITETPAAPEAAASPAAPAEPEIIKKGRAEKPEAD